MKSALILTAIISLLTTAVHGSVLGLEPRATGGYVQNPSGSASFTSSPGCSSPACGKTTTGFTAGMSQLAFGSEPGLGPGDACGRCFKVTATADPYSAGFTGPFKTIVLKVNNLCPAGNNSQWCGQTTSKPTNSFGQSVHFNLCQDTGAADAFFPTGHGALTGTYEEVACDQWSGTDGQGLFDSACLAGETAAIWPAVGCGNQGTAPS